MPRQPRKKSVTGIYHVITRGVNREPIFRNIEDYAKYLTILKDAIHVSGFHLYAYCLMNNHVHLLMHEGVESLSLTLKRIDIKYACWFNQKYQRCGHLFQDRFKSLPVNNDPYFLTLLRYIHRNPVKAGLCKNVANYGWSSYSEYSTCPYMIDTDYPLSFFSADRTKALAAFIKYLNLEKVVEDADPIMQPFDRQLINEEHKHLMHQLYTTSTTAQQKCQDHNFTNLSQRDSNIKELRANGISIKRVAEMLNISTWQVRNVK